eukprot:INCI7513.1.p2 GENE.INCI7513.1~~INCI7513.1.p2  ORF type:complete len:613 (-),score=100.21 INCI7513.1:2915-4753(-)
MLRSLARAQWGGLRNFHRRVLASPAAPRLQPQQLGRCLGSYHPPEPANVIRVLHKAQNILGTRFNFSRIVMVGDQSSGKTSVLEGLIGEDISQKDNQMATRRPLLLSLIRTPPGSGMCAKFKDGERMYDFAEVKARILAENDVQDGDISPEPIQLTIYSEDVFDTILVDLPGFILSPQAHQDAELPHQIEKLNLPYLHDPQAILCVINSATVDPATSYSLREAFKADRAGDRSIGVVTKVDLVGENKDALSRMLRNEVYPIGLGRVGVRCRTHQEQLDGMSWPAAIKREAEWIETSGLKDKQGIRLGMPLLRQTLSELLIARVCKQLPLVIAQLDKRIKDAEHNQDFLKRLANEPNLRTVSKELESLVNQLHPASDSRSDFEKELRDAMYAVTEEAFAAARAAHKFDFEHTTETRLLDQAKVPDYVSPAMTGTGYYDGYTPIAEYRSLLIANDQSHMDGVNNDTLRRLQKRGVQIGACAAYFDFIVPPNPRKARRQWFRDWNKALNRVLEAPSEDGDADAHADHTIEGDNLLAQRSYETFMDQLVQFAESAETDGNRCVPPSMAWASALCNRNDRAVCFLLLVVDLIDLQPSVGTCSAVLSLYPEEDLQPHP